MQENIFSARTDASHRDHKRKVVGPALSTSKIGSYEPVISKHASVFLSRLTAALKDTSTVDITTYTHRYTFDTLLEIIYGESVFPNPYTNTRGAESVLSGFKSISKLAWSASLLPWYGRLMATRPMVYLSRRPTYDAKGSLTGIAALSTQIRDVIFDHPEVGLKSEQPSLLQNYLQVPKSDTKRMHPDELWRELFNLTIAGQGSTAAGLITTLYNLGTHPEWQDRIRTEFSVDNTSDLSPSSELVAVIKETLRLHTPFPTAFPREIASGAENIISDLPAPIPVGTVVSANPYILGHSKKIWGDDAESWRPERWLIAEGDEGESERKKRLDDGFVAFSKGPRGCIGKEIAMLMLEKAVLQVLGRWNIRAEGEIKGDNFLEMQYTQCKIRFTERLG